MYKYKVYIEDGKEMAFRYALESFDKNASIKKESDHLLVETILRKNDLMFTMVTNIVPYFPVDVSDMPRDPSVKRFVENWWDREDDIAASLDMSEKMKSIPIRKVNNKTIIKRKFDIKLNEKQVNNLKEIREEIQKMKNDGFVVKFFETEYYGCKLRHPLK